MFSIVVVIRESISMQLLGIIDIMYCFITNVTEYSSIMYTRMAPGGPTGLARTEFEVLMLTEVRFGNVVDCLALRTNRPNPNRQDLRES